MTKREVIQYLILPLLVLSSALVSSFPTDRRHHSAEQLFRHRFLAPDNAPPAAQGPGGAGEEGANGIDEPQLEPIEDTDSPTPSPGAVKLFLCTQNPKPANDKFCKETLIDGTYYTTNDACLAECWGMIACPSIYCVTESPTLSPTISGVPTIVPTISRVPSSEEPTTESPATTISLSPVSSSPSALPSAQPSESSSGVSFSVVNTNGQDPIESIPLSPFRLDFILLVDDNSNSNDAKMRRTLLRGVGLGEQEDTRRELQSPLFGPAQDAELLSLVSNHLLDQFTNNLVGKPISVELGIDDKAEQNVRDGKVMVSYSYIGHAVYSATRNDEWNTPRLLPSMVDVDSTVLSSFNTRQGKRAWLNAVQYSEDDVLQGMVNVIASNIPIMTVNQAIKDESETDLVDSSSSGAKTTAIVNPIVAVIAVAFATTLLVIGFLTYRKYQKYKRSNADNDYLNYQSRKRKGAIEMNIKNRKRYDHFESPEGSVVSPSEDHLNDLEIVGGDTYPASQDYSDAEPTNTTLRQQFHLHDESSPYDEDAQQNTTTASTSMVYYSHAANQMMMNESKNGDDETLEGLYSDKDSYFQSTFAPSINGQQRYGEGIHSVHSLDTLDNTFGFTTAQSMDGLDNPEEKITHLIEGFEEIIDKNERESSSKNVAVPVHDLSTTLVSTDDIVSGDSNDKGQEEVSVVDDSPEGDARRSPNTNFVHDSNKVADSCYLPKNVAERRTSEESDESIKTETPSHTSDTSDTDELFARITELENKMIQTESSLKTSTFDETSDSTDELYSRITELENKICRTESRLASASTDEMDVEVVNTHESEQIDVQAPPDIPHAPSNTLSGIFTADTLVKIEENRLKCTPPPSEGEVDNDIIKAAKENTLLGKFLDESSDDESSIFAQ